MVCLRRCQLGPSREAPAWTATAGTAAPAPAPAPSTHSGGEPARYSAAKARITIRPGTMNAIPPASAPARPWTRQAQKIASSVEAGPGSRLQAAIASSNSCAEIQPRRSTHSCRSSAMCAGGPPNPMQPMRLHSRAIVSSETSGRAGAGDPALGGGGGASAGSAWAGGADPPGGWGGASAGGADPPAGGGGPAGGGPAGGGPDGAGGSIRRPPGSAACIASFLPVSQGEANYSTQFVIMGHGHGVI